MIDPAPLIVRAPPLDTQLLVSGVLYLTTKVEPLFLVFSAMNAVFEPDSWLSQRLAARGPQHSETTQGLHLSN